MTWQEFEQRLQMDAGDLLDCRNADAPLLEIELLEGKAAWLNAELFRVGFAPFWNLLSVRDSLIAFLDFLEPIPPTVQTAIPMTPVVWVKRSLPCTPSTTCVACPCAMALPSVPVKAGMKKMKTTWLRSPKLCTYPRRFQYLGFHQMQDGLWFNIHRSFPSDVTGVRPKTEVVQSDPGWVDTLFLFGFISSVCFSYL